MRLFFALWPPAGTARALGEWAREVQRGSGGRVTRDETIHLTLAFLGDGDPDVARTAARGVRGKAFDLEIDAAKYWRHNRIVWVGPQEMPPALKGLVAELHPALGKSGFRLEERPFAAHITLVRKADVPRSIPPLPPVSWPADEFVLVSSRPSTEGSRYEILERFPLLRRGLRSKLVKESGAKLN